MSDNKKLIAEHKKLIPILRDGSDKRREAEADDQAKELADMDKEELVFKANGQWSLTKSGYGPKGANLYDPHVNQERKSNNTGDQVADAGKNVNVKEYSSAKFGSAKTQAAELSSKQAKINSKQPVKTVLDPELKAKLEAELNNRISKS